MNRLPAVPEKHRTLLELVSCYSPSGKEAQAVSYLVDRMTALGYSQTRVDDAGNAIGIMGSGPRQIVLLGHIDTVPGEIPINIEENRLYGRGTTDAKGSLAAFVDATAQVGPLPGCQVVVIGAVDEEGDSAGARHVRGRYQPDFAIIGEPSRWNRITLGYKGSARATVTIRKTEAHPAAQESTAAEEAVAIWHNICAWGETYNRDKARVFDQVSPTLVGFTSGSDGFERWAQLEIQTRLPVPLTPADWLQHLEPVVSPAEVTGRGYPIPAYKGPKNSPLVRAFLSAIRRLEGKPGFVLKSGTADLNIVAPSWDCPAVAYGPGDSALDHRPDEHLALADFERAKTVLVEVLKHLAS